MKKKQAPPETTQWEHLFILDSDPELPLQTRLRKTIVDAILGGKLRPGSALPSSRELANRIGLSRNTVTAVYQHLTDEGFIQARERSGVYVAKSPVQAARSEPSAVPGTNAPRWANRVVKSLATTSSIAKPENWAKYPYPFVYGTYDNDLFPTEDFRECCSKSLARSQLRHWTQDLESDDVPELIEQIRTRLLPKRGVFALQDEILVTVGAQQAYFLLAEALLETKTKVGMEEPGYPHARNIFAMRSKKIIDIPVDHQGLQVDNLPKLDYLFTTPSHQSPTTATLNLSRRKSLLGQAETADFVIIEDDYEAENLYDGQPMPALKSLDQLGRVIYIGSVSKSLSPALRLGYIVAPKALISELRLIRHAMVRHPSAFLQYTYSLFLALGHHDSHTRKVNLAMKNRLDIALSSIGNYLPSCTVIAPQGGASLWVKAPSWVHSIALASTARQYGVLIESGEIFFNNPPFPCNYFRLRLSSISVAAVEQGIKALATALQQLAHSRGVQDV
jgi:GntR family transcriptional regulator / MocR family aminotransferase